MNLAQKIRARIGIAIGDSVGARTSPSHRKAGPGRRHFEGDGSRTAKQKSAGAFSRGLHNNITRKQLAELA